MPKQLDEKQIQGLQRLLSLLEPDTLTKEQFTENFKRVLKFLSDLKAKNQGEFTNLHSSISNLSNKLKEENTFRGTELKTLIKTEIEKLTPKEIALVVENYKSIIKSYENKLLEIDDKVNLLKDGNDGKDADEELITKNIIKKVQDLIVGKTIQHIPQAGKYLKKGLESLKGKNKLKISAIKGLREELNKRGKTIYTGSGGGSGGGHVKAYDLSASLDGSTKTFTLPAFWRIISIQSSSFPNAFRLTTDYTVDASAFTITFTSEITAGTTLATGQTITIIYAEA